MGILVKSPRFSAGLEGSPRKRSVQAFRQAFREKWKLCSLQHFSMPRSDSTVVAPMLQQDHLQKEREGNQGRDEDRCQSSEGGHDTSRQLRVLSLSCTPKEPPSLDRDPSIPTRINQKHRCEVLVVPKIGVPFWYPYIVGAVI